MLGGFLAIFGMLFLCQRFTIGLIPIFKKQIGRFSIGDILFTFSSLAFIFAYVDFYKIY